MRLILSGLLFAALTGFGGAAMASDALKTAVFAGGCFWCMEHPFDSLKGVTDVQAGYAGGHVENPAYKDVSEGGTGHREVIQVTYDPEKVGYADLLEVYWRNVDPFDAQGQFCDKGAQYAAAIYAADEQEKALTEASKSAMGKRFGQETTVLIVPAATFYPAEEYHQDYYLKNPWRYKYYRGGCGRDKRLKEVWGGEAGGAH